MSPPRNTSAYAKWLDNHIKGGHCPHCGMRIHRNWSAYCKHRDKKHRKE